MIKKIFLSILFCIFTACVGKNSTQTPEIRIVDANGVYRPIDKRVPVLNLQMQQQQQNQAAGIPTQPFPTEVEQPISRVMPSQMGYMSPQMEQPIMEGSIEDAQMIPQNPGSYEYNGSTALAPVAQENYPNPNYPNPTSQQIPKQNFAKPAGKTKYSFGGNSSKNNDQAHVSTLAVNPNYAVAPVVEPKSLGVIRKPNSAKTFKIANTTTAVENSAQTIPQNQPLPSGTFVQIGTYSSQNNANSALGKAQNIASGFVKEVKSGQSTVYKAFIGPVSNSSEGAILLNKAKEQGFKSSFITKN